MNALVSLLYLCFLSFSLVTISSGTQTLPAGLAGSDYAGQLPRVQALPHRLLVQQTKTTLPTTAKKPPKIKCPPNCDSLFAKIHKHGPQLIVVNLKQADLELVRLREARDRAIVSMQDRILNRLAAQNIRPKKVTRSKYASSIGLTADSAMLTALMIDPEVESIEENVIMYPAL